MDTLFEGLNLLMPYVLENQCICLIHQQQRIYDPGCYEIRDGGLDLQD
jgi:hypothetical protein